MSILPIIVVLTAALLTAFGSLCLKLGAKRFSLNLFKQLKNWWILLGAFIFSIGTALYLYAIRLESISVLYPVASTQYIWISLFSAIVLKEKMNTLKWAGVLLIMGGVALIGLGA